MKVTVIGASGLIGGYLVQHLLAEPSVQHVKILVRKKLDLAHNKLEQVLVNFEDPTKLESALKGTDAVCVAVGTTQAKVKGDMAAYRKVDYDIPVNSARAAAAPGLWFLPPGILRGCRCKCFQLLPQIKRRGGRRNKKNGSTLGQYFPPFYAVGQPSRIQTG
ncbi:MAG: NAD(P)H-binding protein [Saprospiraceae bacterium]|nr:NAD(P)H-binding protein [Saprospiraceae bacterium]